MKDFSPHHIFPAVTFRGSSGPEAVSTMPKGPILVIKGLVGWLTTTKDTLCCVIRCGGVGRSKTLLCDDLV